MAEVAFPRKIALAFYALLLFAGIVFYLIWGFTYGAWNLLAPEWLGAYAVTIMLVGFGLVGVLLYSRE